MLNDGLKGYTYDTSVYTVTYVITLDSANAKLVPKRTFTKNGQKVAEDDADAFTNEFTEDTEDLTPHIVIIKETTSKPANGSKYVTGETISYKVTVKNDGDIDLVDVKVEDALLGKSGDAAWTVAKLAIGESKVFTGSYIVTEADAKAGSVKNEATATAKDPEDPGKPDDPDEPLNPVVPDKPATREDPTEVRKPQISITKETTSKPKNGDAYAKDESIAYKVTVTNDGNIDLYNVKVEDALLGKTGNAVWTVDKLAVGESKSFTGSYKVTDADLKEGKVQNVANAIAEVPADPSDPDNPDAERTVIKPDKPGVTEDKTQKPSVPAGGNGGPGGGSPDAAGPKGSPKTGDDTPIMTWLLMLLAAAALGGTCIAVRRRRRRG